jgi:hypothetical protein
MYGLLKALTMFRISLPDEHTQRAYACGRVVTADLIKQWPLLTVLLWHMKLLGN